MLATATTAIIDIDIDETISNNDICEIEIGWQCLQHKEILVPMRVFCRCNSKSTHLEY